jgi:CheY-like chemotaxis protein
MNLCTNAGHAMREKGGILEVRLTEVELNGDFIAGHPGMHPGRHVLLSVSDTGHGMTPLVMERIFDPFFTTKERGEGTGMGLSVVHGIVKALGGTITVYSEVAKGATFNIYLPVIEGREKEETETEAPAEGGHERILFVDDEPSLAKMGRRMLERLGYEVVTSTSSLEALECFRAQADRFDLVITDMTMPKMDGEALAAEMMRIRRDLPVILCTGFSTTEIEERVKDNGIRAVIMKPILQRQIAGTVREVLEGRRV